MYNDLPNSSPPILHRLPNQHLLLQLDAFFQSILEIHTKLDIALFLKLNQEENKFSLKPKQMRIWEMNACYESTYFLRKSNWKTIWKSG